jgi:TetR/AcrR family transcriptional regulator
VAGELFGQGGYEAVTMARVARGVGLRQPSLYYYFSNKEALLAAFVAQSYGAGIDLARRIAADGGSPAAQIWRFVRADVTLLCSLPFAVTDIHRVAVGDQPVFAGYWEDRHALEQCVAEMVRAGTRSRQLRPVHSMRTAQLVLLTDDAAQGWHRQYGAVSPSVIAEEVAEMTVRGVLADPSQTDRVRGEADLFGHPI